MKMLKAQPRQPVPRTRKQVPSPVPAAGAAAAAPERIEPSRLPPPVALSLARPLPVRPAPHWGTWIGRTVAGRLHGVANPGLLPLMFNAGSVAEVLDLQLAVLHRLQQLQEDWRQGWLLWLEELQQLGKVETLSEEVEQQYNLAEQFSALLKTQFTDLLELQDKIEVDCGYWAAQKMRAASSGS